MAKTKRKTKKQILIDKKEKAFATMYGSPPEPLTLQESSKYKESWHEIIGVPIVVVIVIGIVIAAIPWVLNVAFWLVKGFFEYWGWVNKFF